MQLHNCKATDFRYATTSTTTPADKNKTLKITQKLIYSTFSELTLYALATFWMVWSWNQQYDPMQFHLMQLAQLAKQVSPYSAKCLTTTHITYI